jgi:hypothetical protein
MEKNPDDLKNQKTTANRAEKSDAAPKSDAPKSDAPKSDAPKSDAPKSDAPKTSSSKSLRPSKFGIPKLTFPNFRFPKFKTGKVKISFPKVRFLFISLAIILVSYTCIGYFLSVLLTMRSQKNLAIAGFVIFALLPIITAFADYALMKWGYLISGILIIAGLIFLVPLKFYLIVLAIIVWLGLTAIAFVGDVLSKTKRLWMAILILTIPCLLGLGIGHQIWRLAAAALS